MRVVVHGDLRFVHRFEQGRLRFRRGAVDFIRDDNVGEDRAGFEIESLRGRIEHADADHVAGKHVRGELDSLEGTIERPCKRLSQSCFTDSRNVFDKQVAAREKRGERQLNDVFFAFHHSGDRAQEPGEARAGVRGRCLQLARPSVTKS